MANISSETNQIRSAIYGEEVRDAIISALRKVANESTNLSQLVDEIEADLSNRVRINTANIRMKGDNLYFDEEQNLLYLMSDGVVIGDGIAVSTGGGGGGGGSQTYVYKPHLHNELPDKYITTTVGSSVELQFTYTSVDEDGEDDGNGIGRIVIDSVVKKTFSAVQGLNTVDITDVLAPGENRVTVKVENSEGTVRVLNYVVTVVVLSLTTTEGSITECHGQATVYYTVTGAGDKTVHFILDGTEIDREVVASSGRSRSYVIDEQKHGSHILEMYAESDMDDIHLESERIRLCLFWVGSEATPIIATPFNQATAIEGDTIVIPYAVYDPSNELASVTLSVIDGNGEVYSTQQITKDRSTTDSWIVSSYPYGNITFRIACGNTTKDLAVAVTQYTFPISRVTDSLLFAFSPEGRSNSESNPATWEDAYGNSATFSGFGWSASDGWLTDSDNKPVLSLLPGDSVSFDFEPFAADVANTGYTIELDFATKDVRDFTSVVMSCLDEGRGFKIESQKASLFSEQSSVSMLFKEDSHLKVTFVVEQKVKHRMIYIFVNGVMCGVTQYAQNDNFSQRTPAGITVGTSNCGLLLYGMHIYGKELSRNEVLDNLICDEPTLVSRRSKYNKNDILAVDESVSVNKLPLDLPYMVIACPELPQSKGNKKECTITFVDPLNSARSFVASGAEIDVQGTTSAKYPTKNFTISLKGGLVSNGQSQSTYQLRPGDIPTDLFCLKVDYASSEGANNVELVQLYEDMCNSLNFKTPPQLENSAIRQGIAGRPIALFWHDTVHNETVFYSKANFNNDKDTPEVFGFEDYPAMEVWDFRNNTTPYTNFQTDDFTGDAWQTDLKSIYPDKYFDTTALQRVFTFVASHDRTTAADATEAAEMLADFKAHFSDYFVTNNVLFYYLFTEFFLMVDSRAKNMHFATFDGTHWLVLPYDMDTALGIDNDGKLVFDYNLEDTDSVNGDQVFNGQNSVLWCNVRDAFESELKTLYASMRAGQIFNYSAIRERFVNHQAVWPERLWNEDSFNKYLKPLFDDGIDRINMLQGDKSSQRDWWLNGAIKYRDSKYHTGDATTSVVLLRGYTDNDHPINTQNITLTAYAPVYAAVDYASGYLEKHRMERNTSHTFVNPMSNMWNTEIYIHSADQISDFGDLSPLNIGEAVFSPATRLQQLIIGSSAAGYENTHLTNLVVGNNPLLTQLNICNCKALSTNVDLSGCPVIETVLATGSTTTGIQLPVGGHLQRLELPATVTNLTVRDQSNLTTFAMEGYTSLSTLRIENTPNIPIETIINAATSLSRVRLMGIEWTATNESALQSMIDRLDTCQGLDNADNTVAKAVVYGRVNIASISGDLFVHIQDNYPNLVVVVNGSPQYVVHYVNYDNSKIYNQVVADGGNATDPVTAGLVSAPTKPADQNGTTYAFSGWATALPTNIHENKTVVAAYTASYPVKYVQDDGTTVIQTKTVVHGQSTSYTGNTPTKAQTAQYTYAFKEWVGADDRTTGAIQQVTEPRTVTASYTQTIRQYTATFYAEDRTTVLQTSTVNYGTTVQFTGTTPTKTDYEFDGWEPSSMVITANTSFYPKFVQNSGVEDVEIQDDWTTICANVDNGTYAAKYKVGNYKPMDLGTEGTINMQIVAIDNEEAPLVFVAKELLVTDSKMNSTNTNAGGYPATDVMKPYLNDTILPLIPEAVRQHIKPVSKTSYDKTSGGDLTSTEKLWIPSGREIFGGSSYEQSGPVYNSIYTDANSRKKMVYGASSATLWWLRSAYSDYNSGFRVVLNSGIVSGNGASGSFGVCLGFCLSSDTISDSWDDIATAISDGTYSTKYVVGNRKIVDLGDQGAISMQIVAFDADELADGSGTAAITWVAKQLLVTTKGMSSSDTNTNGYPATSVMRPYLAENGTIWNKLPETLKTLIKPVSKTSYDKTSSGDLTSTEKLWIPSAREIFGGTDCEQSGPVYNLIYKDTESRKKARFEMSSFTKWWLRSAHSGYSTQFCQVDTDGIMTGNRASFTASICLGFCI